MPYFARAALRARQLLLMGVFVLPIALVAPGCHEAGGPGGDVDLDNGAIPEGLTGPPGGRLIHGTIEVDGTTRRYAVYVPAELDGSPNPLVIELHGGGVYIEDMTGESGHRTPYKLWMSLADLDGFVVVYPEGLNGSYGRPTWNDCRADAVVSSSADDVSFISVLIDEIASRYGVDTRRVYVSGTSNGGLMALRLAVELPGKVAAVAAVAASMPARSECAEAADPISVLFMNGTEDNYLPYDGGVVSDPPNPDHGTVLPTEESVRLWVARDQADDAPVELDFSDISEDDGSVVTRYTYSNGRNGTQVVLYKVAGGGHAAPSILERYSWLYERYFGKQNHDIETVWEVWKFFRGKTSG